MRVSQSPWDQARCLEWKYFYQPPFLSSAVCEFFSHTPEALQQQPGWEDSSGDRGSWVQPVDAGVSETSISDGEPHIPSLLSMSTRNHMDITIPPLPPVAPEVLRVAEHRHRRGLMYPYIYHVLTKVREHIPIHLPDTAPQDLIVTKLQRQQRKVRELVFLWKENNPKD